MTTTGLELSGGGVLSGRMDGTPTMASPSWWGADTIRLRGRLDDVAVHVRRYTDAAKSYVNVAAAVSGTAAAGDDGIGPAVVSADGDSGEIVLADLTETHRTATLADGNSADFVRAYFQIRSRVADLRPTVVREATVFDDIRELDVRLHEAGAAIPTELTYFRRILDDAENRINATGFDREFRHGDGNLSNVMVSRTDGSLLLLDWDFAAVMDPFQDLGVALVELAEDETHARELFEIAYGNFDEALLAQCLFYGYADHVRQGMLGMLVDALDPGSYEYSKFGDWQLLRARLALSGTRSGELLRRIDR
ncbi:phosphotransferase [Gordonia westfalica]|uniref:Phosphotransferase n=1 Tax=Gordonia westfalica TaxID=158898 RepID=A0ABU2GLW6_9ACTN|nr:phosphotransferase [Gordonia westfalica]MDS1112457.1 phosphotransferase [Gordonia westfalica]